MLGDAEDSVWSVAFSADAQLLASGSKDKKVRVYGLREGAEPRLQHVLGDAEDSVRSVAFSADARLLASGSEDKKVRVYGLREGAERRADSNDVPNAYLVDRSRGFACLEVESL